MDSQYVNDTDLRALMNIIKELLPLDASSREVVLASAAAFVKAKAPTAKGDVPDATLAGTHVQPPPFAEGRHTDIRSLKEEKQPRTAIEMATLVAYFLAELAKEDEQKTALTSADIKKYFKQAQFQLPSDPNMTLHNSKNAGYLDALGNGRFKLNAVGYNLVAHKLPSDDGTSAKKTKPKTKKPTVKAKAEPKSKANTGSASKPKAKAGGKSRGK